MNTVFRELSAVRAKEDRKYGSREPDWSITRPRLSPPELPGQVFGTYWRYWHKRQAEIASAPADYVAGALLASASTLIGNSRWISPWSGWAEPPVLWVGLVGNPSSGKSPGIDSVRRHLSALEAEATSDLSERLRQWEADREVARMRRDAWEKDVKTAFDQNQLAPVLPENAVEPDEPTRPRLWSIDTTQEAIGLILAQHFKGLLIHRDELAGWIGGFDRYGGGSKGERPFWIEAYGGRPYSIDRVKHKQPIKIPHLAVGVLGGIQPDILAQMLLTGGDDGLSSRFLYFWPDRIIPKRPTNAAEIPDTLNALRRLQCLSPATNENGEPTPLVISLTDEAADLFDTWRQEHSLHEPDGRFGGWWGKMPGTILRLALVLEYLWWCAEPKSPEPKQITKAAVDAAALLVDKYLKPMAQRTYGDASLPDADRNMATLGNWIQKTRPAKVNARQIRRDLHLPGLREAAPVKEALEGLVEAGWVERNPSRNSKHPGRNKADFIVSPYILEAKNE